MLAGINMRDLGWHGLRMHPAEKRWYLEGEYLAEFGLIRDRGSILGGGQLGG